MRKGQFIKGNGQHYRFKGMFGEILKVGKTSCLVKYYELTSEKYIWIDKKYLQEIKKGELFK